MTNDCAWVGLHGSARHLLLSLVSGFAFLSGCGSQPTEIECDQGLRVVSITAAGLAYALELDGTRAFVTNNDGVLAFDIENPSHPVLIGTLDTGVTFDIWIEGDLGVVVGEEGLFVLDVSDPTNPRIQGSHDLRGVAWAVQVQGQTAFVGSEEGFEVVDISDVHDLRELAFLAFDGRVRGITLRDEIAFVGGHFGGLRVLDVSVPTSPTQVANLGAIPAVEGFDLEGETLFVASHHYGIRMVDVSDPQAPTLIGSFFDGDGGEALAIAADGGIAIVADNFRVEWLNVVEPTDVRQMAECKNVNGTHDVEFDGSFVYVAEGMRGLIILGLGEGAEP